MKKYIKLMRIHHYIKNILIFLPLIFSGRLFDFNLLLNAVLGFFSFSLISSAVYVINDINDREADSRHPTKKNRPIASGSIQVKSAYILLALLISCSLIFMYFAANSNYYSVIFILIYFILNILYSKILKHIPILDIAILASGFLLRVIYGSAVTGIEISNWLYLTVMAVSFYMGFGKRRNEIKSSADGSRKVLKYYNHDFLDKNMYVCLGLTIAFYALWCVDPVTIQRISRGNLVWTVPFVMLIALRYSLNIEMESDGDPVEVIISDKILIGLVLIYAVITYLIIY